MRRTLIYETMQTVPREIELLASDCVPWRLWGEICQNEEWDWPHPLQSKRKTPSDISVECDGSTSNTRRQKDAGSPAHADIGGYIWSKNGWDDFRSVRGGKGLWRMVSTSRDLSEQHRLTWKTPHGMPQRASPTARTGREGAKKGMKMAPTNHTMKNIMV